MSINIQILPINISFENWASQLIVDLKQYQIPNPPSVNNWKFWASQIATNPNFKNVPVPSEINYPGKDGWKKWAFDFISLNR